MSASITVYSEYMVMTSALPLGFTRALCLEMSARSIRVNALLPGWVQSEMWESESLNPP